MTLGPGGLVCPTAAKKCEVKLERLSPSAAGSTTDLGKFKRPLSAADDDLRPPVKLKVKINGVNGNIKSEVTTANSNKVRNYAAQQAPLPSQRSTNTARGGAMSQPPVRY